jgi:RND family efflux transporter MFP subunit
LRPLAEKDYISKSEYEVALTQSKALQATVAANSAALQQAKLQLAYTSIAAPISGRTGSLSVKPGNLVAGGTGGAALVVINSTRPILVSLSVPQRYLDAVRAAWDKGQLKVAISPSPNAPVVAEGALVFIDNAVNQQSGTIAVKARVKNEKEELWPGQFVAARIILRVEEGAIVLPESAVLPGQDGSFVYVIKDGRAQVQNIVVDRQINNLLVVSKGVDDGQEVVNFSNSVCYFRRRYTVANTPTCDRISFRHRIHDDCALTHSVDLGHRDVTNVGAVARIQNVFVDLVGEAQRIEFLAKTGDVFHLVPGKDFARRIIRIANNDRFSFIAECRSQFVAVKTPIRRTQRNVSRLRV